MKRSSERILTTHAGSLPRPQDLIEPFLKEGSRVFESTAGATRLREAVAEIVRKQTTIGVDVVSDGEFGKPSFVAYVNERLGGIAPDKNAPPRISWLESREGRSFPDFYASGSGVHPFERMSCVAPLTYVGQAQLKRDIDNFKAALAGWPATEAFMPAISPANVEDWLWNAYYKTQEEYLFAIADALHEEYRAITDAGLLLQIDDPRLITYWIRQPGMTLAECRKWAEIRVTALNHALRGIPREKIRFHTCYGINMGPRVHDMELKDIVDLILQINAGAFSFEAANPRHEHEWQVWEKVKLPPGAVLIPGVISHTTVLVEHPELVAQRIERFARIVGRENVIAGTDCGFATFAGSKEVHPSIVWAKFESLVGGARLASKRLWNATNKRAAL
jgi:5-methyltetrahydropteroyltriglutamate--homocysteine methyltransferase